jgi:hypothetical protein
MKKIDLGQAIGIIANVGVIAGILFLAFELRQNNEYMQAQDRFNRLSAIFSILDNQMESGLANLIEKDRSSSELTVAEEFKLQSYYLKILRNLEWAFEVTPYDRGWVGGVCRSYRANPGLRRAWNGGSEGEVFLAKDVFDPDFVDFFEENIATCF